MPTTMLTFFRCIHHQSASNCYSFISSSLHFTTQPLSHNVQHRMIGSLTVQNGEENCRNSSQVMPALVFRVTMKTCQIIVCAMNEALANALHAATAVTCFCIQFIQSMLSSTYIYFAVILIWNCHKQNNVKFALTLGRYAYVM
jgi:hypothetical protein